MAKLLEFFHVLFDDDKLSLDGVGILEFWTITNDCSYSSKNFSSLRKSNISCFVALINNVQCFISRVVDCRLIDKQLMIFNISLKHTIIMITSNLANCMARLPL